MESERSCRILADKIITILERGFVLSDDAVHYIESTFPNPSLESLRAAIKDEDGSEIGPFYELLFFPDAFMQMELEDILKTENYTKEDEKTVLDMLVSRLPETPVHFPDARGTLYLRIPEWTAEQFISRLKVYKQLEDRISRSVDTNVPGEKRNGVRIKFRNSRFVQTEKRISFFCAYFEKLKDSCKECLDLMISLFEESDDNRDIYQTLVEKKRFYFQSALKALRYAQMLQYENMETLFAQGVRVTYADKQDAERKMEIIDKVSRSVFGKTECFQKPDEIVEASEYQIVD